MRNPRSTLGGLSGRRIGRPLLVAGLVVLAVSCSSTKGPAGESPATSTPGATSTSPALTVASTLDGHATLPHRIHWEARPSVPTDEISEVASSSTTRWPGWSTMRRTSLGTTVATW
jgi:hypothetical protein